MSEYANDLLVAFGQLFEGRADAYGSNYGSSERLPNDAHDTVPFASHLYGHEFIGTYPMVFLSDVNHPAVPDIGWSCKWGCVDLDVKTEGKTRFDYETTTDAYVAAKNLCRALGTFDIDGWTEITKSGGFHVWVFATDWVPAKTMRRALLVACEVADVPPTEVNPKSEGFDDPNTLGNYVRLPYPGALTPDWEPESHRQVVWDEDGYALPLDTFVADAEERLVNARELENVAALYRPPVPVRAVEFEGTADCDSAYLKLNRLGQVIVDNPPLEGQDRSMRLFRLAHRCVESGLEPAEAFAVLYMADMKHGQKFVDRSDCERRLEDIVRKAYA